MAVAAAATKAVAAEEAAAAAEVAAEAAGARRKEEKPNEITISSFNSAKIFLIVFAVTLGGVLQAAPEEKKDAAASQSKGKEFNTPKEAADALIQAAESFDVAALKEILGTGSDDIITRKMQLRIRTGPWPSSPKRRKRQRSELIPRIRIAPS